MDRDIIRNHVKKIRIISQSLDAMMELNDRKYPDSYLALQFREMIELKELMFENAELSDYIREATDGIGLQ